jgi:hypothetical protein
VKTLHQPETSLRALDLVSRRFNGEGMLEDEDEELPDTYFDDELEYD